MASMCVRILTNKETGALVRALSRHRWVVRIVHNTFAISRVIAVFTYKQGLI